MTGLVGIISILVIGLLACTSGDETTFSSGDESHSSERLSDEGIQAKLIGSEWLVESVSGFSQQASEVQVGESRSGISFPEVEGPSGQRQVFIELYDGCNGGSRPISWTEDGVRIESNSGDLQGLTTERLCTEGSTPILELLVTGRILTVALNADGLVMADGPKTLTAVKIT